MYSQVKEKVLRYRQKLNKQLTPQVPKSKKKVVKETLHGKTFVRAFSKENEIPDELFTRYFDLRELDEDIYAEVRKYTEILHIGYEIGVFDIVDLVSNPKTNGMTYIESLNRLYDKRDSVDYDERTFKRHMINLRRNWIQFNDGRMCLWNSYFEKIGDKFYISNYNGSHLTCLCKLIALSGLSDKELILPSGFVKSLESIRTLYRNTPDDLEFILMFNRMYELMKQIKPSTKFYLKRADEKGINVIGVEGLKIEISTVAEILTFLKVQLALKCRENKSQISKAFQTIEIAPKIHGDE